MPQDHFVFHNNPVIAIALIKWINWHSKDNSNNGFIGNISKEQLFIYQLQQL